MISKSCLRSPKGAAPVPRTEQPVSIVLGVVLSLSLLMAAAPYAMAGGRSTDRNENAELNATDGTPGDSFGLHVALSGSTAIVGSPGHSGIGAAYVFVRTRAGWSQQAELTPSDGASGDCFGYTVALWVGSPGATAVIGAPCKNSYTGAAYVFVRPTNSVTWSQQAELMAMHGAANDDFGNGVAVAGSTAIVGAFGSPGGGLTGAAYVFHRSNDLTWHQKARLTASDGSPGARFGLSIAISGPRAIIGAYGKHSFTGAAYVFVHTNPGWSQQAELTASDGARGDAFGGNVSLSGSTALVGASGKNSSTGAAYVFVDANPGWSQQAELTALHGSQGDAFGSSVGISGPNAVIGAVYRKSFAGAAYWFQESGMTWSQKATLTASDGASGDQLGYSTSVSGSRALVGAPFKNSSTGVAYVFSV